MCHPNRFFFLKKACFLEGETWIHTSKHLFWAVKFNSRTSALITLAADMQGVCDDVICRRWMRITNVYWTLLCFSAMNQITPVCWLSLRSCTDQQCPLGGALAKVQHVSISSMLKVNTFLRRVQRDSTQVVWFEWCWINFLSPLLSPLCPSPRRKLQKKTSSFSLLSPDGWSLSGVRTHLLHLHFTDNFN